MVGLPPKLNPPPGFTPSPALPERLLARIPTREIVEPKRTMLGRFTGNWQKVDRASGGQIDGRAAWVFDYLASRSDGDDNYKDRYSVVVVELGGAQALVRLQKRGAFGRLAGRMVSPGVRSATRRSTGHSRCGVRRLSPCHC